MTGQFIQQKEIMEKSAPLFTYQNILIILFIIISSILLIRFAFNIFSLIRKTIKCKKVDNLKTVLVLVEEKTIPYSFFRYVFVNQSDFESGKIERELLVHEEAHCLQYHSIDIIILELINVVLWFNPAIWLYRQAILLNHEYYADNKVLTNSDSKDYHQLLLNLVLQNNSNYLVSNFKYSLIKNRLIMMTQSRPSNNAILRKIAAISLFLFLGIAFTFSQENKLTGNVSNFDTVWLKPILQKHKIDLKQFNYKNIFRMAPKDSTTNIFCEIGNIDSLINKKIILKDAIFIYKGNDSLYGLVTAKFSTHYLDKNKIEFKNGLLEIYNINNIKPIKSAAFQESSDEWSLKLDPKTQTMTIYGIGGMK